MKPAIPPLILLCLGVLSSPASAAIEGPGGSSLPTPMSNQEEQGTPPKPIEPPKEAEPDC